MQKAKEQGLGDVLKDRLLTAYFCEGANVAAESELIAIAKSVGISKADALESQTDEKYTEAVNHDIHEARRLNISGVPFFVINEKYGISGAQPEEVFRSTILKVRGEESREMAD